MKSIAYITTTFPTLACFIESEVHRLIQRGVKVRVFTLREVGRQYQPEHAELVGITRAMGNPLSPPGWAALLGWLFRRPEVLIPEVTRVLWASKWTLYGLVGHLGYLPAAALIACAVEAENLEIVHGAWAHFPGTVAYLVARLTRRPLTLAGHAGSDLYRTQAFLAEKVRAAEFTATCVRGNAEMLRALAPDARIEWIYHGVDLVRFDGTGRVRDPEPLLLTVGRLAETKGFGTAIRGLAALKQRGLAPRLVMVGDGPERESLAALARQLGVANQVSMIGSVTHRELLPLYQRAWVLIAPSVVLSNGRRDGIPNVIIEAMAMGVPCVGTRAAGLEEVIVPGETGALCDPEDAVGLAAELDALLRAPAEIDRLGARARERVRREFDAERNFERMLALFHDSSRRAHGSPVEITTARTGPARITRLPGGAPPRSAMAAAQAPSNPDSAGTAGAARIYPMTRMPSEEGTRQAFESFVRWTIQEERAAAPTFLPHGEIEPFLDYYQALPAAGDETLIRRYLRGLWRSEAGWAARWIAERAHGPRADGERIRVLDAGSGFGTYSMLFASVGAEVVGADLRPDRLSAAERRLNHYRDRTGRALPIRYERADLTRRWQQDCDLVWVYNALSHIDPLEDFLRLVREHLRPGGVLVVGDINGAHPSHVRRLAELRSEVHQEYVAPDGQRHAYAVERPFPPEELREILVANGFHVVHHELYWLGLSRLPDPVYDGMMAPLQRQWRLGVSVARRQLMVASPHPGAMRKIPA